MKKIVVVMSDLFFSAKINDAAKKLGTTISVIQDPVLAMERIGELPPLVILDLNCASVEPIDLIRKIKANPATKAVPVVGFVSHVQTDVRKAAAEAGCDVVVPRSVFASDLPEILAKFIPKADAVAG